MWGAFGLLCWALLQGPAARAEEQRWKEEDFYRKLSLNVPTAVVQSSDSNVARTVIGSTRLYYPKAGDTFLDLARFYGLGYNEIEDANPHVDAWIPPADQPLVLPTEFVLPDARYEGIVVNIPEMRLFYFPPRKAGGPVTVITFPVGLGRDDWRTPEGSFVVRGKTKDPVWNIPESIRQERIKEKGRYEKSIPGGDPDNPLGRYRIELSLPMYRIHGTNIPWGVGMQISHGCIRLYPEDIEQFFPMVKVGTPGSFVYQPVKIGARDGHIFLEAHRDIYTLTPGLYSEARRILHEKGWGDLVDVKRIESALEAQSGVPVDVTLNAAQKPDLVQGPGPDAEAARHHSRAAEGSAGAVLD
jgi:L,D-transpeptidase ErfK/SrfK